MTAQGHEFLDDIRSDTVWNRVMGTTADAGFGALGFVIDLAKAYARQQVSEATGIIP